LRLGPHGSADLRRLRRPDTSDAGMMQTRQVWISKRAPNHTLFVHTVSNGALNVPPLGGVTIDEVRVTSPWFHTRSGLSTASTLAQIRRAFPRLRREPPDRTVGKTMIYDDSKRGIAFEFPRNSPLARCIGITAYIPGSASDSGQPITQADVAQILRTRSAR
jgi:hypothetical protein